MKHFLPYSLPTSLIGKAPGLKVLRNNLPLNKSQICQLGCNVIAGVGSPSSPLMRRQSPSTLCILTAQRTLQISCRKFLSLVSASAAFQKLSIKNCIQSLPSEMGISLEFLITSVIVVLIPGAGVVFTISTGPVRGHKASMFATLGCTADFTALTS